MQYIILFTSYYFADKADKALSLDGIDHQLIATPREIDDACGLAIRVESDYLPSVEASLLVHKISRSGIYQYEKGKPSKRL